MRLKADTVPVRLKASQGVPQRISRHLPEIQNLRDSESPGFRISACTSASLVDSHGAEARASAEARGSAKARASAWSLRCSLRGELASEEQKGACACVCVFVCARAPPEPVRLKRGVSLHTSHGAFA